MQQINARKPAPKPKKRRQRDERSKSWERRLRAAGMNWNDERPENIDAFRNALARRIYMFINHWHGCPQRLCRRQRGCMAPNGRCANAPPQPPSSPEAQARVMAQVYRTVQAAAERQGED